MLMFPVVYDPFTPSDRDRVVAVCLAGRPLHSGGDVRHVRAVLPGRPAGSVCQYTAGQTPALRPRGQ